VHSEQPAIKSLQEEVACGGAPPPSESGARVMFGGHEHSSGSSR
jgi:hypothetical protein